MNGLHSNDNRRYAFLHVDDNLNDQELVKSAVELTGKPLVIIPFESGAPALAYLRREPPFIDVKVNPWPTFILLDYKLGSETGAELIPKIRKIRNCERIPIVMLCGALGMDNLNECYDLGANYFLTKPPGMSRLCAVMEALYQCAAGSPPDFGNLTKLEEYSARPRAWDSTNGPRRYSMRALQTLPRPPN